MASQCHVLQDTLFLEYFPRFTALLMKATNSMTACNLFHYNCSSHSYIHFIQEFALQSLSLGPPLEYHYIATYTFVNMLLK